jgi:predicted nucleic acid-binding Zn ribbon protein
MPTSNSGDNKIQAKCPFCAELIPSDAVVCPYCKRNLSNQVKSTTNSPQKPTPMDMHTKSKEGKGSKVLRIILLTLIGIVILCGVMIILAAL